MSNSEFEQVLEDIATMNTEDDAALADLEEYIDNLSPEIDTEE